MDLPCKYNLNKI